MVPVAKRRIGIDIEDEDLVLLAGAAKRQGVSLEELIFGVIRRTADAIRDRDEGLYRDCRVSGSGVEGGSLDTTDASGRDPR